MNRRSTSHTLDNLQCGTVYQFTLAAFNKIGTGTASKIEVARTKGKKPISPEVYHFIRTNITSVSLDLSAWQDGGCSIQSFTVEFRKADSANANDWIVVSSNVPAKSRYSIPDLEPATVYNLRITSHNNAGSTIAAYIFKTLTVNGDGERNDLILTGDATINNSIDGSSMDSIQRTFNLDFNILILSFGSILGIASALMCACFCFRSRKYNNNLQQVFEALKFQNFILNNFHRNEFR